MLEVVHMRREATADAVGAVEVLHLIGVNAPCEQQRDSMDDQDPDEDQQEPLPLARPVLPGGRQL